MAGKKKVNNKKVMYDFPVDDFTQKENGSLFSSRRSTMQMAVSVTERWAKIILLRW